MRLAQVAYPLAPGDGWWNLELDFCVAKVRPRRLLHIIQTSHSLDQRNPAIWASLRFSYMRLLDWQRFSTANSWISWPKPIHLIQTPRKNSLAQEKTSSGDEAITTPSPASWLEPLTHWLGRPSRGMCEIVMVKVRHDLIELFSMHCSIPPTAGQQDLQRLEGGWNSMKFQSVWCLPQIMRSYEVHLVAQGSWQLHWCCRNTQTFVFGQDGHLRPLAEVQIETQKHVEGLCRSGEGLCLGDPWRWQSGSADSRWDLAYYAGAQAVQSFAGLLASLPWELIHIFLVFMVFGA